MYWTRIGWPELPAYYVTMISNLPEMYCAVKRFAPALKTAQAGRDARRFQINTAQLPFHSDQGATDLISLLSLSKAKSGGASQWVSGIAIHNEMLRRGRKVSILCRRKLQCKGLGEGS